MFVILLRIFVFGKSFFRDLSIRCGTDSRYNRNRCICPSMSVHYPIASNTARGGLTAYAANLSLFLQPSQRVRSRVRPGLWPNTRASVSAVKSLAPECGTALDIVLLLIRRFSRLAGKRVTRKLQQSPQSPHSLTAPTPRQPQVVVIPWAWHSHSWLCFLLLRRPHVHPTSNRS